MVSKNSSKKTLILIIVLGFMIGLMLPSNRAKALIPVIDPANLTVNTTTAVTSTANKILNFLKEFVIKPLVRKIANSLENKLVNKVNGTISNIDGKSPAFITNWRNQILDSQARGNDVFRSVLADTKLCGYFDQSLKTSFGADKFVGAIKGAKITDASGKVVYENKTNVPGTASFQTSANCTLPPNFDVSAFNKDFKQGGWQAWDRLLEPQNNFFGAYAMAVNEQSKQVATESQSSQDSSIAGQGFLSQKLGTGGSSGPTGCAKVYASSDAGPAVSTRCTFMGKEVTPAKLLGESTANALDAKLKRVGGATELTDVLLNLFAAVLNGATNSLTNFIGQATYDRPPSAGTTGGFPEQQFQPGADDPNFDNQINGIPSSIQNPTADAWTATQACLSNCQASGSSSSTCDIKCGVAPNPNVLTP